jgi:hypothetical protein
MGVEMIFSKRLKLSKLAIKWCEEHSTDKYDIRQDAFGIITALDALGYLKHDEEYPDMNGEESK